MAILLHERGLLKNGGSDPFGAQTERRGGTGQGSDWMDRQPIG
jgi:hypothetical protein